MVAYNLIVFLLFIGIGMYIIPKSGFEFDLNRIKLRLFPNWFKVIAVCWIIISIGLAILFKHENEKVVEYLVSSMNLSLFIFVFSKQKFEDEFSQHIRFKAITYSFIAFVAMVGAFSALGIRETESDTFLNNRLLQLLMGATLLMATLYFYITTYKLRKENN